MFRLIRVLFVCLLIACVPLAGAVVLSVNGDGETGDLIGWYANKTDTLKISQNKPHSGNYCISYTAKKKSEGLVNIPCTGVLDRSGDAPVEGTVWLRCGIPLKVKFLLNFYKDGELTHNKELEKTILPKKWQELKIETKTEAGDDEVRALIIIPEGATIDVDDVSVDGPMASIVTEWEMY